jgi:hypothetical protein
MEISWSISPLTEEKKERTEKIRISLGKQKMEKQPKLKKERKEGHQATALQIQDQSSCSNKNKFLISTLLGGGKRTQSPKSSSCCVNRKTKKWAW